MTADLQMQAYETEPLLYMAMALSNEEWRLAFSEGTDQRQVVIAAGDVAALWAQIAKAKAKWELPAQTLVVSC